MNLFYIDIDNHKFYNKIKDFLQLTGPPTE